MPPTFVASVGALKPLELRRHLLGAYVPAWTEMVGADVLEQAVRGDTRAAKRLLAHDRYYGGRARESLAALLPLTPAETKQRVLAALRAYADDVFRPEEDRLRRGVAGRRSRKAAPGPEPARPRADHRFGTRLRVRARAGVQPRRPRPSPRRPAVEPALPAPRRSHHLLRGHRPSSTRNALAQTSSSDSDARWATASGWRSCCDCGSHRPPSPSSQKRSGSPGRRRTTISRCCGRPV